MSNNPNDVKSQDDVTSTQDKRSVDVLVHAVEKCERLQKQLDIAVECLEKYAHYENWTHLDSHGGECAVWDIDNEGCELALDTLKQIKELEK